MSVIAMDEYEATEDGDVAPAPKFVRTSGEHTRMNLKTPAQISKFLGDFSHKLDNPDVYYGDEPNTYHWTEQQWDDAKLKHVLLSPWDYLQSVGNMTIPLLYQLINEQNYPSIVTERTYFPSSHGEVEFLRKRGMPLWGLETRHSLGEFDVIGTTLNYTPYYINIVMALRMSGIPVRAREREDCREQYPLVVVGGHIFADPWAVAPVADIIWCGEAEDESLEAAASAPPISDEKYDSQQWFRQHSPSDNPGYHAFLNDLADYKARGMYYDAEGREQMLHELAVKYPFLLVPRFYQVNHEFVKYSEADAERLGQEGYWKVVGWTKRYADLPTRIVKRFVRNLDAVPMLARAVVPFHNPGMGLGQTQSARGCSYHCGFCAAAYREAPYRERSQAVMVQGFKDIIHYTGTTEVAPLQLEFGTYSRKKALMKETLETVTPRLSMPSLRVDVFSGDPVFGQIAVHAQKKNVTIAVEGNSQKMREVISKGITEEDILRSIAYSIAAGYDSAKLYMIANLPGETLEDIEEIYQLCLKIDAIRKSAGSNMRIRLSWKPLTVQAHTPMQWLQARNWEASIGDTMRKIQALGFGCMFGDEARSGLGNYIQVSELADDVAGEALLDSIIECDTQTFGALPNTMYAALKKNLAKYGRTFWDYYRPKDTKEVFAWDVVDPLISKGYLLRHYKNMMRRVNDDPELIIYGNGFTEKFGGCQIGCTACGACGTGQTEQLAVMEEFAKRTDDVVNLKDIRKLDMGIVRQKLLLTCDIAPDRRFVTRAAWTFALRRACNLAGVKVNFNNLNFLTDRIQCMKKWFAGKDYVELGLLQPEIDPDSVIERINANLGVPGFRVVGVTLMDSLQSLKQLYPGSFGQDSLWELVVDKLPAAQLRAAVEAARADATRKLKYRIVTYRTGQHTEEIALSEVLHDVWVVVEGSSAKLVMLLDPLFSPYDAANAVVGQRTDIYRYPAVLKAALGGLDRSSADAFTQFCSNEECGNPIPTEFGKQQPGLFCPRCSYARTPVLSTF